MNHREQKIYETSKKCPVCNGTGRVIDDQKMGFFCRKLRQQKGISLRKMAKRLNISAPFLSDLELGRRKWTTKRKDEFMNFIQRKEVKL